MRNGVLLLLVALAFTPGRAAAQRHLGVEGGASLVGVYTEAEGGSGALPSSGVAAEGALAIRAGRFRISGTYLEGTLDAEDGDGPGTEFVHGSLSAEVRVLPWLHLGAGARAYDLTTGESEHWGLWLLGGRIEVPIIGEMLKGNVGLWQAFEVSVNTPAENVTGRFGEVGLRLQVPQQPLWVALTTGIDHAGSNGGQTRSIRMLHVTVGIRTRQ